MKLLITGGAGYIGSHTSHQLVEAGHSLTIIDNLSTGYQWALPAQCNFLKGDIQNQQLVKEAVLNQKFDALLHFAANIEVEESVREPAKYYRNNTFAALSLFEICIAAGIKNFIFSSTAAVYGNSSSAEGLSENSPLAPLSPYGASKLMSERILADLAAAAPGVNYAILRYFNVAGAREDLKIGQATPNATHLIKAAAETAIGKRSHLTVHGSDYQTPDGTCMRDYIHVDDLAAAHINALNFVSEQKSSGIFNVGYGRPYSVLEVIEAMKRVSGNNFEVRMSQRRSGDVASISANNTKAREILGWTPQRDDLAFICETALNWEKRLLEKTKGLKA